MYYFFLFFLLTSAISYASQENEKPYTASIYTLQRDNIVTWKLNAHKRDNEGYLKPCVLLASVGCYIPPKNGKIHLIGLTKKEPKALDFLLYGVKNAIAPQLGISKEQIITYALTNENPAEIRSWVSDIRNEHYLTN